MTAQSLLIGNLVEIMTRLVPASTKYMLPSLAEYARELISSVSTAPTTIHTDEVHASSSDREGKSPTSHYLAYIRTLLLCFSICNKI